MEDVMNCDDCVARYIEDLEEGMVERRLGLPWDSDTDGCPYRLVWNQMELACGMRFCDYVENHGMTVDKPVDLVLVKYEPSRY